LILWIDAQGYVAEELGFAVGFFGLEVEGREGSVDVEDNI
jgi:hypothetical protein